MVAYATYYIYDLLMTRREESIGRWIHILHRIGQTYIAHELEPFHIGKGQHSFLTALFHHDGISQNDLASILHMDKGAVAHALRKLERAGYIERKKDAVDRRVNLVYLTAKARELEPVLFSVLSSWTDTLADGFSEEERRHTLSFLRRMSENAARALETQKQRSVSHKNSV